MDAAHIVNTATAKQLAESINMKHFECSAVIILFLYLLFIKKIKF
jgi:hypothetical protein